MNKALLVLALLACIALASCVRKCNGCQEGEIRFAGFDSTSLEQVIVKQYSRGSGFNDLIDSVSIFLSEDTSRLYYYDTINRFVSWTAFGIYWPKTPGRSVRFLTSDYEYEIDVPNAGKVFRIGDMICAEAKSSCSGGTSGASACLCVNALEFYRLNGMEVYTNHGGAVYCSTCRPDITLQR